MLNENKSRVALSANSMVIHCWCWLSIVALPLSCVHRGSWIVDKNDMLPYNKESSHVDSVHSFVRQERDSILRNLKQKNMYVHKSSGLKRENNRPASSWFTAIHYVVSGLCVTQYVQLLLTRLTFTARLAYALCFTEHRAPTRNKLANANCELQIAIKHKTYSHTHWY